MRDSLGSIPWLEETPVFYPRCMGVGEDAWWREPTAASGVCWKCHGSGYLAQFGRTADGLCFACKGTGRLFSSEDQGAVEEAARSGSLESPRQTESEAARRSSSLSNRSKPRANAAHGSVEMASHRGRVIAAFVKKHGSWSRQLLYDLREADPARFQRALESIEAGRCDAVLSHLQAWSRSRES